MTFNHDLLSYASGKGDPPHPWCRIRPITTSCPCFEPSPASNVFRFSLPFWGSRRQETLIVAPHPYFPGTYSLNGYLLKHLDLFDALEYCHFYSSMINFNQKALEVCQSFGFPLIGNSDAHFLSQLGTTYSLIYAEKNLDSIFAAIRGNRVEVVTRPLKTLEMGTHCKSIP